MSYPLFDQPAYKSLSDDELASVLVNWKEQAAELRQNIWRLEDELRDRLLLRQASVILTENYRVKSSMKRETTWDQLGLAQAQDVARESGLEAHFRRAFPVKYDCSVRNLNALLKLGGATAQAIEAAKIETKEKLTITVETKA